jgi:hypothetical protein
MIVFNYTPRFLFATLCMLESCNSTNLLLCLLVSLRVVTHTKQGPCKHTRMQTRTVAGATVVQIATRVIGINVASPRA